MLYLAAVCQELKAEFYKYLAPLNINDFRNNVSLKIRKRKPQNNFAFLKLYAVIYQGWAVGATNYI